MPSSKQLLAFAVLLEGCGYYGCNDTLKFRYVPQKQGPTRWQDSTTLEVDFGSPLRAPTEVDPRRFALLRYNVEIDDDPYDYYCNFDVCYRELGGVEAIPESLSWDPEEPEVLRLHFADPVPAGSCKPWPHTWADYQALELIYLGVEDSYGYGDTGSYGEAMPDQLAWSNDLPIEEFGPDQALQWLEHCSVGEPCEFADFCIDRGGYDDPYRHELSLWVDCL